MAKSKYRSFGDRSRVGFDCGEERITKQNFKDECDINNIMARFTRTGVLEHVSRGTGEFLDVTGVEEYHESLALVSEARERFAALPAEVRAHFDNDPAELLAAVDDPDRRDELVELGIVPGISSDGEPNRAAAPPEQSGSVPAKSAPGEEDMP